MSENQEAGNTGEDLYYLKPEERVNLTNCDREPIHIISHVQPHGALLVLDPAELIILQATENTLQLFGIAADALSGQNADTLFTKEQTEELRDKAQTGTLEANPLYLFDATLQRAGPFHCIAHVYQGLLLVELEPLSSGATSPDYYALIKTTLARFEGATNVEDFAQIVCEEVRRICGFDRVMLYRFMEDYSGQVIAEDIAPEQRTVQESYLGLRYPASDIPKQARALFVLNTIRLIPNAGYVAASVVPQINPLTNRPLDMSYAFLRGVSPMHVEYLRNMGVQASMSLAIVKEGELWGLVTCHHYAPHTIGYDVRTSCEFLARVIALQLAEKERNDQAHLRQRLEEMHTSLLENMAQKRSLLPALVEGEPNVTTFVDCSGCAVLVGKECRLSGNTPTEAQVLALSNWLAVTHNTEVYATHTLPAEYPEAQSFKAVACGVLALQISYGGGGYVLWFRPEVIQTVNWAGAPTKTSGVGSNSDSLTPRRSFALWQETVAETALAWKPVEIEAVRRLRISVIEAMARLAQELTISNERLSRSNAELDSFAYIASHDLKEPLRGIHNFSHFLKEDFGDILPPEGHEQIDTILKLTRRMEALIDSLMHYSRVGRLELTYQPCDLNVLLNDVLDALRLRIEETGAEIRIPQPLPTASCDRVQIGEVFHNLIYNALKYNDKQEKWIEIGYLTTGIEASASHITLYVKDNGIGIDMAHQEAIFRIFKRLHGREEYGGGSGAGLTIARKIVDRHNGHLWIESTPGVGSTFYFTLPKGAK